MLKHTDVALHQLNQELKLISQQENNSISYYETAIQTTLSAIKKIQQYSAIYRFKNKVDEIHFFKHIKPQFFAKIIYYTKMLNIQTKLPKGSYDAQKNYYISHLDELKHFFDNNLEFYQYYRTQSTYLDDIYFIRGKHEIKISLDTFFFATDPNFNTSHDFKVAKILANDLLEVYLKEQLATLETKEQIDIKHKITPSIKLSWTDSKVSLTELVYALYHQGCFNNGKADVKEIAAYFELMFNIDLGDVYRTWYAIKNRKIDTTAYLETLKNLLQKKIDAED